MQAYMKHNKMPARTPFAPLAEATWRVLLVTLDEHVAPLLGRDAGQIFTVVASPQACREALAAHRTDTFAAIVIDWQLGDAGGRALLETLRLREYPAPLIALLPPERPALVHDARQVGASGWLIKTADYRLQLPHVVAAAIAHAQLQRQHRHTEVALQRAQREAAVAQERGARLQR